MEQFVKTIKLYGYLYWSDLPKVGDQSGGGIN